MKLIIVAALLSTTAFAQEISGVAVLKGTLKTKTVVENIPTTCKVKVEKVRNIMEEDAFGFPGYKLKMKISLDGKNSKQETVVTLDKDFELTNFWNENGKIVAKDFEYFSADGALLSIKADGRLKSMTVPYKNQKVICNF